MAATIAELPVKKEDYFQIIRKGKPITWEQFKNRYLSREDGFTYEWVNGYVEKTKRTMDYKQLIIVRSLLRLFQKISAEFNINGILTTEVDTFFSGSHRRPDMCFLTDEQIDAVATDVPPVPQFVIEIISNNDKAKRVQSKMVDYRRAGVGVVWQIFPDIEQVVIHKGKISETFFENEICSAAPVLPDFQISVKQIFNK